MQDESSLIVGEAAPVNEDSVVIDVCAAPGGKSIHIADKMHGEGLIRACDLTKEKVTLIRQNLIRTGFHNVKLKKHDAMEFTRNGKRPLMWSWRIAMLRSWCDRTQGRYQI